MKTASELEFALKFLDDELETLLALSMVLMNQLEDTRDAETGNGVTAWRLAQVLNDRLASVEFSRNFRHILLSKSYPPRSIL